MKRERHERREEHKMKPESKHEHKPHKEFSDNRLIDDKHQEGIKRVLQRRGDMESGQGGKMGEGRHSESEFNRSGDSLTPRRA